MLSYREARHGDIPDLLKLEQGVIEAEKPYNPLIRNDQTHYYDLNDLIESDQAYLLIAETADKIVATGYIKIVQSKHALVHDNHGYLGFMFVEPSYRGQGINQEIIRQLIAWAEAKGISDFYLDVYSQNQPAIKAYEKLGFTSSMIEMRLSK